MSMYRRAIFYPLLFVIVVALACSGPGGAPSPTNTVPLPTEPEPADSPEAVVVEADEEEDTSSATPKAASNLSEARNAVFRIVVQGAYEYPDFGSYEESYSGTGFIISPDGTAVTNNHVVTGAALVDVYFPDDPDPYRAKLKGYSECSDLAVIEIEGNDHPYLEWYTGEVDLGLDVYSLGYPLGDPEFSQHQGAISKKSATVETNWAYVDKVVEHDALINPGNSGGPLVTADGKVIGVNYAGMLDAKQYYAITYNEASPILEELKAGESPLSIGINGEAFNTGDGLSGIWIYSVQSGSPADKTGVKPGDIIIEMEGIGLAKEGTMSEYCGILRAHGKEDVLSLKVLRYNTGETFVGQINGRQLVLEGTEGAATTSGDTGSSEDSGSGDSGSTSSGSAWYTEEFEQNKDNWSKFIVSGAETNMDVLMGNGLLSFALKDPGQYVYVFNEDFTYDDVYVEAEFENLGHNFNGIALVCRANDAGWYEFRVSSTGMYAVYRYDAEEKSRGRNPYIGMVGPYSATAINAGYAKTNTAGLICSGDELRLFVNDQEIIQPNKKAITDSFLSDGVIGVGVISESSSGSAGSDVLIDFEYVGTGQP